MCTFEIRKQRFSEPGRQFISKIPLKTFQNGSKTRMNLLGKIDQESLYEITKKTWSYRIPQFQKSEFSNTIAIPCPPPIQREATP